MNPSQLKGKLEQLHPESFGWALHCCQQDREAAADVLQMVYFKILEGKARYSGAASMKTWLFSVIRFTAIDFLKKQRRYQPLTNVEAKTEELPSDQQTDQEHYQRVFKQALAQLSAQQREVLHLVFYQELSIREAANIMNIKLGTARTH